MGATPFYLAIFKALANYVCEQVQQDICVVLYT